jgi:integrase
MNFPNPVGVLPENTTLITAFETYRAARPLGQSTRTERTYETAWLGFADFRRDAAQSEPTLSDLSGENLNAYLAYGMESRRWGAQSAKTYAGSIRSVVTGLLRQGHLVNDPLTGFAAPKVPERAPVYFDEPTLVAIFDSLERDRTTMNLRLRAIVQIMLDCGARPAEVCSLRFRDLDTSNSRILLYGKGGKERRVPVGVRTWRYLDDYLSVRPRPKTLDEPLLLNIRGANLAALPETVSGDFNELLIKLGLAVRASRATGLADDSGYNLYTLRKTFAHRAAEGGMDVGELAVMMGHATNSIPMLLERYFRPSDVQMQAAHAGAQPADGFHDRRERGEVTAAARAGSLEYFERWATPSRRTAEGNKPSRMPASRSRTAGAYRATSRTSSAWPTGA